MKESRHNSYPLPADSACPNDAFLSLSVIKYTNCRYNLCVVYRSARTVPQDVNSQMGLGDQMGAKHNKTRSYSAPFANPDALPPNSPDSSDFRSVSPSTLSNISEAQDVEQEQDGDGSGSEGYPENLALPAEALDRITLFSGSPTKTNGSVPLAPRPGSNNRAVSRSPEYSNRSSRPGSERHMVLPPIAQCS